MNGAPRSGPPGYADLTDGRGRPPIRPPRDDRGGPDEDEDDDEPREHGFLGAALATIMWYLIPTAIYLGWALLLGDTARPGCVDAAGAPCLSPHDQAIQNLLSNLPKLGGAIALSLIVALLIRWITSIWRGLSVGFAAAVVGAGLATVLFTVLKT
jgi:hypothetical protein